MVSELEHIGDPRAKPFSARSSHIPVPFRNISSSLLYLLHLTTRQYCPANDARIDG
jgi:hypothetical protein